MANQLTVRRIKGWQIGLGLLALVAVGLLMVKMFGQDGFFRHVFDRSADGIGWLLDRAADTGSWIGDGIESGFSAVGKWYDETDFTDYDWNPFD